MTIKELENIGGELIVSLTIISFKLYIDTNDNNKKFIFISSFYDDVDITDADDRIKQFKTTETATKHCLKIAKSFANNLLIEVKKFQDEKVASAEREKA